MDEESDRSDFFGFRRNWNLAIPICPPKLNPSLGAAATIDLEVMRFDEIFLNIRIPETEIIF